MTWLLDGKTKIEDLFIRFIGIHERDEQTDRHCTTDRGYAYHRAAKIGRHRLNLL